MNEREDWARLDDLMALSELEQLWPAVRAPDDFARRVVSRKRSLQGRRNISTRLGVLWRWQLCLLRQARLPRTYRYYGLSVNVAALRMWSWREHLWMQRLVADSWPLCESSSEDPTTKDPDHISIIVNLLKETAYEIHIITC